MERPSSVLQYILNFGGKVSKIFAKLLTLGYSTEIHLICFEDAFRSGMVKKIIMETNENNQAMRGFCEKYVGGNI